MFKLTSIEIFGRHTVLSDSQNFEAIAAFIAARKASKVFFCNVHMLMLSQEDSALAQAMNSADLVFADGVPVAWLQRRITMEQAQVIRGYKMMEAICERAAVFGDTVGFLGSTTKVLDKLVYNLKRRFPGLKVAYRHAPAFMPEEISLDDQELKVISSANPNWLFVGFGCPKQEKWIAKQGSRLDCHVLGVGAAFDWLAGTTSKPPEWMENAGLAWIYRLFQNPRGMFHRYMIYNSKFVLKSLKYIF
jgi:N-acetylglucosaminyldiphosphoundecaprenol N-acetyl-beta-D-mannosaminyltransferase